MSDGDRDAVRAYYDEYGEVERERLSATVSGRVGYEVHRRWLRRFLPPGARVLEIGAGPGRFTTALADLGARIVVTDISPVQLDLNRRYVANTPAEAYVEERRVLDVCDVGEFEDGAFDAVIAFGGPLSYAFEQDVAALTGLFRVAKPDGVVLASVMSTLGTWRHLLAGVSASAHEVGQDLNDAVLRTGDLRLMPGASHVCRMYRSREIEPLVKSAGGVLLATSASNWASLDDAETLLALEADAVRWSHFLDNEVAACAEPGTQDGGTHILLAARRAR